MTKLAEAFTGNRAPLLPALPTGHAAQAFAAFAAVLSSHGQAVAGAHSRHSQVFADLARAMNTGTPPAYGRNLAEGLQALISASTNLAALINAAAPKNTAMLDMLEALRGTTSPSIVAQLAADRWKPPVPRSPVRELRPVEPVAAEPTPVPAPAEAEPDSGWWSDPRAASYLLALLVCVAFVVETRVILGAEVWREVRDDSAWVAEYTALVGTLVFAIWLAANRRNRR
jgi:hypothetical protein